MIRSAWNLGHRGRATEPRVVQPGGIDYPRMHQAAVERAEAAESARDSWRDVAADLTAELTAARDRVEHLWPCRIDLIEAMPADDDATYRPASCQAVVTAAGSGRWQWRCDGCDMREVITPEMLVGDVERFAYARATVHEGATRFDPTPTKEAP